MELKKYVYSSKESYNNDPQYLQIQVTKKIDNNKIIFLLNFDYINIFEQLSTLIFRYIEPLEISEKTYSLFKATGTSVDSYTLNNKIISNLVPKNKEGMSSSSVEETYKYLEVDLSNAHYDLDIENTTLMLVLEANSNFTDEEKTSIEEKNPFEFYAEITDYKGMSKSSKVDEYVLDNNCSIIVKRDDGDVFYNIGLMTSLHKRYPLSLSLVGSNSVNTNDFLFPYNIRLNCQCDFRTV